MLSSGHTSMWKASCCASLSSVSSSSSTLELFWRSAFSVRMSFREALRASFGSSKSSATLWTMADSSEPSRVTTGSSIFEEDKKTAFASAKYFDQFVFR